MAPQEFIAAIGVSAQASMRLTKIPASFTIAQSALESSWGGSQLSTLGCNLFGVKADSSWKGATLNLPTKEFLSGKWVIVPATWRKYANWLDCLNDHGAFITGNKRYQPAFAHTGDPEAFAKAIAVAGYATDPQYSGKIISVIRTHNLTSFDRGAHD
ncbi:mannosyl-glycoprotein endo-beta-N-acetylglucosamidase [Glaciimonas sp. PCH181]|nr:mannosyl-glycoprotein endo-beta-N-acetylglucosamidase [Glaciimonas sp. PCH181]